MHTNTNGRFNGRRWWPTFFTSAYAPNVFEQRLAQLARRLQRKQTLNKAPREIAIIFVATIIAGLVISSLIGTQIATMIGADSKVLFIDEIEQHLGKKDQKILLSILHRKINYDGITLIASTQNKEILSRIASVTITLESGRITSVRSSGKKNERYRNSKSKKR